MTLPITPAPVVTVDARKRFAIVRKVGGPLIATAMVASALILSLNTDVTGLDASTWPAFANSSHNAVPPPFGVIPLQQPIEMSPSPSPTALSVTNNADQRRQAETQSTRRQPINPLVIHCVLAVTTCLLILLNTWLYLVENDDNPVTCKSKALRNARRLVALCMLAMVSWVFKLILGWNWGSFADAIIPLFVFSVFLVVDFVNYRVFRDQAAVNPSISSLEVESTFASSQAALVDLPVVAGIFVSVVLALYLGWRFSGSEHYFAGFFSGSTVMHLAASQIIYVVLAFKRGLDLAKIGP
jgi:hypothetical protein